MTEGPVLLVTGAARGIGAAIARAGREAGYRIWLHYGTSGAEAEKLATTLGAEAGTCVAHQADLRDGEQIVAMFEAAKSRFGRLDALVNNAGLALPSGPVAALAGAELDDLYRVNFAATVLACQQALRHMTAGGAIVNISSTAAVGGGRGLAVYAAMKAAVNGFTASFAREAAEAGVRVNAVMPGIIDAGDNAALAGEARRRREAGIPLGRFGTPDEVADTVMWLLSAKAAYVSGAVVPVAGAR